ncbi:Cacna1c [Symbiodinium sp. CCMP2456]|nr:Cacna1c [Symbiodinium sp. CCMP2456]
MALNDSPFQRYLAALHSEYDRVVTENVELRKELQKDPLWSFRRVSADSSPPAQPVVAYAATPSTSVPGELPGDPLWHIRADDCEIIEPVQAISACADELGTKNDKSPNGKSPPPGSPKKISVKDYKRQNSRWIDDEESEDSPIFLLMLDVVPAVVIMISAVVAGLSADMDDEHSNIVWEVLEIFFTAFFVGEILIKMRVFGLRVFLMGGDWYWSWFDILCVILAFVDLAITYTTPASQDSDSASLGTLKMLKLARLGRIIRLLKFKIFQELKLMIQGVFTGLRVLTWAVILLLVSMYLLGVITRTLLGQHPEFRDVPSAMFTSFRCVTDGCTAYDGTPLIARLRTEEKDLGGVIMIVYILLFLFVTIGIFNLIMAVFIDNVTDGSTKKRQRQLGANAPKTEWLISSVLRNIILTKILHKEAEEEAWNDDYHAHGRRPSKILKEKLAALQEMYGYKPHTIHEYEQLSNEIRKEMGRRNVVVTREEFNHWLSGEKELITTLDDSEIDLSCKSDLFDVLDADLSGELEFEEMIDGLLKCRGPASKTDIIAVRLKTALLVKLMTQVCEKLGIDT